MPEEGWDDLTIQLLLHELACMDTNNFVGNVGAGEREARIYSRLVQQRHVFLGHGIGRSGDVAAAQPKAAGSTAVVKLTNALVLHALHLAGLLEVRAALVVPLATGMALVLSFLALRASRPDARFVIWPRIDQKTCFKAILTAGLTPVVVENKLEGDELRTDVDAIRAAIARVGGSGAVLCVCSTSSCFAPRAPDRLVDIAKLCAELAVPHVVNNAYGVQLADVTKSLTRAQQAGRVDVLVQSTDKNFMVPVGGAVIAGADPALVGAISKLYPGRASMSPVLDVFVTLLSMGVRGWRALLQQREELLVYFRDRLRAVAANSGERLLECPHNPISVAMTLGTFGTQAAGAAAAADADAARAAVSYFGSMLFSRNVSGARVVAPGALEKIGGTLFRGYGAHADAYPHAYITFACAIGMTRSEVDVLVERLEATVADFRKQQRKAAVAPAEDGKADERGE
jgi:O-phospho-L-seryl-tRNASec:L-selenocysteinyl-tRNA synthase